jgi:hypothetical protein
MEEAGKYSSIKELIEHSSGCYKGICENNWLEDLRKLYNTAPRRPNGYWNNLDLCIEEASKYKNKSELKANAYGCFKFCKKNNWFDKLTFKK